MLPVLRWLPRICATAGLVALTVACRRQDDTQAPVERAGELAPAVRRLAVGLNYACDIADTGAVACWGERERLDDTFMALVDALAPIRSIALDGSGKCAVAADGRAHCWSSIKDSARVLAGVRDPIDLVIGVEICALLADGRVGCWEPVAGEMRVVGDVEGAVQIAAGSSKMCARTGAGRVWCWGADEATARQVTGVLDALDVAVDAEDAWVVHANHTVAMYKDADGAKRRRIKRLRDVVDVEASRGQTCARRVDGRVRCADPGDRFVEVPGLADAVELRVEDYFACARTRGGEVRCWGDNSSYQLGDPAGVDQHHAPLRVTGLPPMTEVRVGVRHACAWGAGELWCWGSGFGSFGAPSADVPQRIAREVRSALVGQVTCAEKSARAFKCEGTTVHRVLDTDVDRPAWLRFPVDTAAIDFEELWGCGAGPRGASCFGAIGYYGKTRQSRDSDVPATRPLEHVSLPGAARSLAVGIDHACAVMADGAALCWGRDGDGQLGNPAGQIDRSEFIKPQVVPGLPPVVQVSAEGTHTCALTTNGVAWCWGAERRNVPRSRPPSPRDRPAPVDGAPPLVQLAAGLRRDCGVDADGAVWCWWGERPPARVPGLSDVKQLHSDGGTTCAVDRAGAVWCWGDNLDGKVDPSSPSSSSTAVPVAATRRFLVKTAPGAAAP